MVLNLSKDRVDFATTVSRNHEIHEINARMCVTYV